MIYAEIILLWISMAIQYRVELGFFSFAFMEPFALLLIATLLSSNLVKHKGLRIPKDKTLYILFALSAWVAFVGIGNNDLQHGLSDIRDWLIPILLYILLVTVVRKGWKELTIIFMLLAVVNSLVGIYQHFSDTFRPFITDLAMYKTSFMITDEDKLALGSYAVGFFDHPNGFAIYLFFALMICVGWIKKIQGRGWITRFFIHSWKIGLCLVLVAALFFTYAKASIIAIAFTFPFFLAALYLNKPKYSFILIFGMIYLSIIAIIVWAGFTFSPPALLITMRWRISLWKTALNTIYTNPVIILYGNGMSLFAERAIYPQPHELYLFSILQYGLPGLLLILWLGWVTFKHGIILFHKGIFIEEPLLAALWVGLTGFFIIGFVETTLLGIENRTIFLSVMACFTGFMREKIKPSTIQHDT